MMMVMVMGYLASEAAGAAGALAVHTSLRCSQHDINIDLARRTRRHFRKNTASASGTAFLQRYSKLRMNSSYRQ